METLRQDKPKLEQVVLLFCENKTNRKRMIVRAEWLPKYRQEAHDENCREYCEEDDCYYCPEGWYEHNEFSLHDYDMWLLPEDVTIHGWLPMPEWPILKGE